MHFLNLGVKGFFEQFVPFGGLCVFILFTFLLLLLLLLLLLFITDIETYPRRFHLVLYLQ